MQGGCWPRRQEQTLMLLRVLVVGIGGVYASAIGKSRLITNDNLAVTRAG